MTEAPERIWVYRYPDEAGNHDIEHRQPQPSDDFDVYIRADASPMTVAEAAKVLLANTPNPIFDVLKYPMMGEFKQSIAVQDEDGEEVWRDVTIEWTTIKEILAAALRALSEGGE